MYPRLVSSSRRGVTFVLLLVGVLLGGHGVTALPGASGPHAGDACGRVCPCEASESEHGYESTESGGSQLESSDPCGDSDNECPPGCPACSCCPGVGQGVVPVAMVAANDVLSGQVSVPTAAGAAKGLRALVYRPPKLCLG